MPPSKLDPNALLHQLETAHSIIDHVAILLIQNCEPTTCPKCHRAEWDAFEQKQAMDFLNAALTRLDKTRRLIQANRASFTKED